VVLITHEDEVARHAKRVIRLVDGQVVDDVRQAPADGPPPALRDPDAFAQAPHPPQRYLQPAPYRAELQSSGSAFGGDQR
jgi:hypothetical protein